MTDIVERLRRAGLKDGFAIILKQYVDEAADEIERLRSTTEISPVHVRELQADRTRLRAALHGLLDEVMCFVVDPPSAALNHAIEEARRALEPKP